MFSIGEFSRITRLTIKTLRLYHEKGLLVPRHVDPDTGYRYYNRKNIETANTIKILRRFEFSLKEIREIVKEYTDESDLVAFLEQKKTEVQTNISRYSDILSALEGIIRAEKEAIVKSSLEFDIEEKEVDTILIAGYRMKGKYEEAGKGFQIISKAAGRYITGNPMSLYYDGEYMEDGADFEPCFPVRKGKNTEELSVRELKGGRAVSVIHKGPYEELGRSYEKIFAYINQKALKTILPTREIYIKGPGLILKGNSLNYLTEILFMIED